MNRQIQLNPAVNTLYKSLEYLESTGTQYIDTGINFIQNPWRLEFKFYLNEGATADNTIFGQRQFGKCVNCYQGSYESVLSIGHASEYGKDITIIMDSANGCWWNGTQTSTATTSGNLSSEYNALMFAFSENSASNPQWKFHGKIYYYKIYSQSKLIHYFIPVISIHERHLGMYDTVTKNFFQNIGSGEFIAGPVV